MRAVAKRLGLKIVSELIDDYSDGGLYCSPLATKYGISKTAVVRLLHAKRGYVGLEDVADTSGQVAARAASKEAVVMTAPELG